MNRFGCSERTKTDLVYFMPHDMTATKLGIEDAMREYEELLQDADSTKERLEDEIKGNQNQMGFI